MEIENNNRTNKALYGIMIILALGLFAMVAIMILGTNDRPVSLEEKSREKGMCVAMEAEETYCINGYLYKKNNNFNKGGKSTLGMYEVDDRPYLPLHGIYECPKPNPLDAKLVKELTSAKEALKKCEADLNVTTQLATQDIHMLQKQVEEMKPMCTKKPEEEKVEVTPTVEEVKPEPIKELKEEVKSGSTKDSKTKQSKKGTKDKR